LQNYGVQGNAFVGLEDFQSGPPYPFFPEHASSSGPFRLSRHTVEQWGPKTKQAEWSRTAGLIDMKAHGWLLNACIRIHVALREYAAGTSFGW
jgi:hypothetical protein